jgi:hypothetical protein
MRSSNKPQQQQQQQQHCRHHLRRALLPTQSPLPKTRSRFAVNKRRKQVFAL